MKDWIKEIGSKQGKLVKIGLKERDNTHRSLSQNLIKN